MPTDGLVISCQTNAPITGAIIKGKISTKRKNFESQFSSFKSKAMPSPSSISSPVAQNAYWRVMESRVPKIGAREGVYVIRESD